MCEVALRANTHGDSWAQSVGTLVFPSLTGYVLTFLKLNRFIYSF